MYTRKTYNHVSISFDDQLKEIYSFGRKQPANPFIGGFVKEQLKTGLLNKARCRIYSCTVSETEYKEMLNKVRQMEARKELYKYNLLGLFAILLNIRLNRTNAFFCSQFVATILNEKHGMVHKSPSLITPYDLMSLQDLEFVYQGELNLYTKYTKEDGICRYLSLSLDSQYR